MRVEQVSVSKIKIDRENRQRHVIQNVEELKISMMVTGLIHPIVIDEEFNLIAGERRLTAAKALGWTKISCRFWESDSDITKAIVELEENLKRQDISWQENCEAVAKIHKLYGKTREDWSQQKTANSLAINLSSLSKILRVQKAIEEDSSLGNAASFVTALGQNKRLREREVEAELEKTLKVSVGKKELKVSKEEKAERDSFILKVENFNEWSSTYKGDRFNLIHCDFPYGINIQKSKQNTTMLGAYEDSKDVYMELLESFAKNLENFASTSSHLVFWFSMNYYCETFDYLSKNTDFILNPFPLIWHKSDGKGIIPDPNRGPRRIYETAFIGARGDRKIVKVVPNLYAAPTTKDIHSTEKSESMLRHFFRMFVDPTTRLLDPTCGSGSAIRAACHLNASSAIGFDLNKEFIEKANKSLSQAITLKGAS